MDADRLASLIRYVRPAEPEDEDTVATLTELYNAAVGYLAGAGVVRGTANAARFDLCANAMVLHWHELRGMALVGTTINQIPEGARIMLNQLKFDAIAPVSNLDTGEETTEGTT